MLPHEIWEGTGAKARAIRTLTTPVSWLYALGWEAYLSIYTLGLKRAASPHKPIVCVGSLMVGGSGKSPLTLYLARLFEKLGRRVVIGCSGYGAPHSAAAALAPLGQLAAAEWGDEPAMFRWLLPNVPLVVGRDRVLAATLVHQSHPDAILLMDDGFQHLRLATDVSLLIDVTGLMNKKCLPAGPLREPYANRVRADLILPGEFQIRSQPMRVVDRNGAAATPTAYSVLCALGQPIRFLTALAAQFPNDRSDVPTVLRPDHDPLTASELWEGLPADIPVVVTAKDWVKLRERVDLNQRQVLIALQDVEVEPQDAFATWVERRLDE